MIITENVYLLDSTSPSYAYLVTGDENTLIDTGLSFRRKGLLHDIEALGIPLNSIKNILITHNDIDHIGNAAVMQELTGAVLQAPEQDIPFIIGEKERYGIKKAIGKIFRVRPPKDIRPLKREQTISGITILPAPGHTIGHCCFLYRDVLFAGDLVENRGGKMLPFRKYSNWNHGLLLVSIQKVYAHDFVWICPAHGKPLKRRETIPK